VLIRSLSENFCFNADLGRVGRAEGEVDCECGAFMEAAPLILKADPVESDCEEIIMSFAA
jgi:hypothetical protein